MAKILEGRRQTLYVWRNLQLTKTRLFLFLVLLMLAFMLFVLNIFPFATVGIIMIPISYVLGVYSYKSYLTWIGGSVGEKAVLEHLKRLDDSFIVISGVVVPPNRGDTDHIVLGGNGIFVIETKNVGGEIYCDGDEWDRRKTGRRGGVYKLKIGNPSNQVKRNAKVLKDFLLTHQKAIFQKKAPHLWVNGVLVFTNKDTLVEVKNQTVEVVKPDALVEYIRGVKSEATYSGSEVERMAEVIMKYSN